jgi:HEPN domain-containing protein
MPDPKRLEEAEEWLQFAAEDTRAAKALLEMGPNLVRQSLLHAQQSAEKALKAFLIGNGERYPRIHDIDRLRTLCAALDPTVSAPALECLDLTPFAGLSRYPGEPRLP